MATPGGHACSLWLGVHIGSLVDSPGVLVATGPTPVFRQSVGRAHLRAVSCRADRNFVLVLGRERRAVEREAPAAHRTEVRVSVAAARHVQRELSPPYLERPASEWRLVETGTLREAGTGGRAW